MSAAPPPQAEAEAEPEAETGADGTRFDEERPMVLGDGAVAAMALAAAVGAWWSAPPAVPLLLPGAALVGLVALRRAQVGVLVVATVLLTASLGERALAGLDPAPAEQLAAVEAALVTDPERRLAGTTAIARVDGRRVELWAHGSAAAALRRAWAGDVVTITGRQRPLPMEDIRRAAWRRVVGEVQVESATGVRSGGVVTGAANELHRRLARGARSLPDGDRALYAGLVLGDDRNQPVALRDAFDAVGLSHLLAVSGQNVAFVLAAAAPLLVRLRLVARWVTVLSLLAFFAVLTRFEPSVLRAVTMAGLAATATALGRPTSGLRVLGLAVTLLLVVDPLLVRSLGFQLSVLASGGILIGAPLLARWSRLPSPLAVAVSVPLAAQLATAPLLAARSGGLSIMSIVANVLVGPAAGAVMTWGSSMGLLAGYLPEPMAAAATLPARVLLWWIREVALRCARLPAGVLPGWAVAIGVAALAVALGRRRAWAAAAPLAGLAVALAATSGPMPLAALPAGTELHRAGAVEVLLIGRPVDGARLLRALRHRVDGPIEVVVVTSPSDGAWRNVDDVRSRHRVSLVVAGVPRPAATVAGAGDRFLAGAMLVEVTAVRRGDRGPSLEVVVTGGADQRSSEPGRDAAGPSP